MKIDDRENISGLIGEFPRYVFYGLKKYDILERTTAVIVLNKDEISSNSIKWRYDSLNLALIKETEYNNMFYFAFQCSRPGIFKIEAYDVESGESLVTGIITAHNKIMSKDEVVFETHWFRGFNRMKGL